MAVREEVLVPLPSPPTRIPLASHVRGSVLLSSIRGLRTCNLFEAYMAALPPERHDTMLGLTAATWYPYELAIDHYAACEKLTLSTDAIERLGAGSGEYLNASVVSVLLRLTREVGATPWGALAHIERLRERLWRGSAFTVVKLGPKEARIEWYGQPCARSPYYKIAFGAFMAAIMQPLSTTLRVRPIPRLCSPSSLGYAVSWV